MVSYHFYSQYRSSVDVSHIQTPSFGFPSNIGMSGFIANIVEAGGLRRRSSSSSRCSVSDEHKRPSLIRNQPTVSPSIGTHKESVCRSPSSSGRTRTATDILSRVAVVSTQNPDISSPVGSPASTCSPQSPTSEARGVQNLARVTSGEHSNVSNGSSSLSDAYFSFPSFGSWNGEDEFDCEEHPTEL